MSDCGGAIASQRSARASFATFSTVSQKHDVDLVALFNQPLTWDSVPNPFSLLPHQTSVDTSARLSLHRTTMNDVLSSSMRSRLRSKERKLQVLSGYRYLQAATDEDIDRLLDTFFALKSSHMAAQGLGNVFADPGVAEFLREACRHKLPNGRRLIEIHALEGGGEVLALFGIIADDYRFSSMFNTYTRGENGRHSPGLVLLTHLVADSVARGLRSFDLGVGRAHYKSFFCREPEPLFDTFLPLTQRGRLAAAAFGMAFAIKRVIKQNHALWSAVQALAPRTRARTVIAYAAALAPAAPTSAPRDALTSTLTLAKPAWSSCSRASAVSGLSSSGATSTARGASLASRSSDASAAAPASRTT